MVACRLCFGLGVPTKNFLDAKCAWLQDTFFIVKTLIGGRNECLRKKCSWFEVFSKILLAHGVKTVVKNISRLNRKVCTQAVYKNKIIHALLYPIFVFYKVQMYPEVE